MLVASKRGDTIMEVAIAITVFCVVSIISMGVMDRDLNSIQGALELEMARNEIDAQAEALRFIHDSYLSESGYSQKDYGGLWKKVSDELVNLPQDISSFTATRCSAYYDSSIGATDDVHSIITDQAFAINTRNLNPSELDNTLVTASENSNIFTASTLYPRIVYQQKEESEESEESEDTDSNLFEDDTMAAFDKIARVEGIWVIATRETHGDDNESVPEFFDYHIRTCWNTPGSNYPTTIATIIRLYNPDFQNP